MRREKQIGWNKILLDVPEIMTVAPASITPLFGRTQYLRGAVVFTLKHTLLSEGFFSLRLVVTTSVKGPGRHRGDRRPQFMLILITKWKQSTEPVQLLLFKYKRKEINEATFQFFCHFCNIWNSTHKTASIQWSCRPGVSVWGFSKKHSQATGQLGPCD